MTTPPTPPFAYGHDGALLVTADGPELLVHAGGDEAPLWRHALGATVMGLGVTERAVVAVDARGEVVACSRDDDGKVLRTVSLERLASGLSAARNGVVAVLGASSVNVVRMDGDGDARLEIDAPGATAVALDPEGRRVAVGGQDGVLRVFDTETGEEQGRCQAVAPVKGICWNPREHWIASTGSGIVRVGARGDELLELIDTRDLELGPVACSREGALCAVRVGTTRVGLFDLLDFELQGAIQYERTVGQVEFGPGAWLGVGLDRGDANKIDLLTGMVSRTDPHEGRPRNRWVVLCDPKTEQIAGVVARARVDPHAFDGQPRSAKPDTAAPLAAPASTVSWPAVIAVVVFALGVLIKLLT